VAHNRGALDHKLAAAAAAKAPASHQVLLPPGQPQQQEEDDQDLTEPGTDEVVELSSVSMLL